jgi:hypothetical protein
MLIMYVYVVWNLLHRPQARIAQSVQGVCMLGNRGSIPGKDRDLLCPRPHQLWRHSAACSMGSGGSFTGGELPGAWCLPLISIWCHTSSRLVRENFSQYRHCLTWQQVVCNLLLTASDGWLTAACSFYKQNCGTVTIIDRLQFQRNSLHGWGTLRWGAPQFLRFAKTIRVFKSRRLKWAEHVACMGKTRNESKFLFEYLKIRDQYGVLA